MNMLTYRRSTVKGIDPSLYPYRFETLPKAQKCVTDADVKIAVPDPGSDYFHPGSRVRNAPEIGIPDPQQRI
jgi:hypothetical protein